MWGQAVSTQLMLELTGARLVDGTVDVGGEGPPPKTIRLRDEKVSGLLGAEVPLGEQAELLERLDFGVVDTGDGLDVTVPPVRRNDVTREVDLIEEVARLWGLDKLPSTLPAHGASGRLDRRAEAAPPRGRRAGRRRVLRGDRLELRSARDGAQAAARAPAVQAAQPALRGPVGDAHDPARLAADRGAPQRRARRARTSGSSRRARSTSTARTGASRPPPRRARRRSPTSACTWPRW